MVKTNEERRTERRTNLFPVYYSHVHVELSIFHVSLLSREESHKTFDRFCNLVGVLHCRGSKLAVIGAVKFAISKITESAR